MYSSLVENAALTTLVLMTKLSLDNISDNLILSMRMQWPNSTRTESIVEKFRSGFFLKLDREC